MVCCGRMKEELFTLDWFSVHDVNGKTVDIPRSFNPKPKLYVAAYKLLFTYLAYDLFFREAAELKSNMLYYFIFLTHWAFLLVLIYAPTSLVVTLFDLAKQPTGTTPSLVVRIIWTLYPMTMTLQVIVTALYWILDYDPVTVGIPSYFNIMKHGGLMLFLLVEGMVVNKIPVRAKHVLFVEAVGLLFCFWTILHSLFNVGNPFNVNTIHDDDVIYNVINWKDSPETTFKIYVVVIVAAIPLLFTFVWTISLCGRRYLDYEPIELNV